MVEGKPDRGILFELQLPAAHMAHVWDHVVAGRALVPGVLFMEMATCSVQQAVLSSGAASELSGISAVSIPSPCLLPDLAQEVTDSQQVQVVLRCLVQPGSVRVASSGVAGSGGARPRVHLQAQPLKVVQVQEADGKEQGSALSLLIRSSAAIEGAAKNSACPPAAVAETDVSAASSAAAAGCVDPSQLDGLLQLAAVQRGVLLPGLAAQLQVPAAADVYSSPTSGALGSDTINCAHFATAAVRPGLTAELMVADIVLQPADAGAGPPACTIMGLQARQATATALVQQQVTALAAQHMQVEDAGEVSLVHAASLKLKVDIQCSTCHVWAQADTPHDFAPLPLSCCWSKHPDFVHPTLGHCALSI